MPHAPLSRIVLMGPPGGGKGTQAKLLQSLLRIPHISTGDLLRAEIKKSTDTGKKIKAQMDEGNLVKDDTMIEVLVQRLSEPDAKKGYILDGFPRTLPQAEYFDKALEEHHQKIDIVIDLQVPDEYTVERVVGRYSCARCGTVYHDLFKRPKVEGVCDVCGSTEFIRRKDDTYEVVTERLRTYRQRTSPILPYYEHKGILKTVNGTGTIGQVARKIQRVLGV